MRRHLLRGLQAGLALGLLALLWSVADGQVALGHLAAANPVWLAAALLALTAQTLLSALRWRLTAAQLGVALGRGSAVREYYLAQIVNQALPGGVLGDAGRALRTRGPAGLIAAGQAVLCERLAGQVALLALFGAAAAGTLAVPGGFDWPGWLVPPVLALLGGGIGAGLVVALAGRHLPGRAGRGLAALAAAFAAAVWAPAVRLRQAALSLGTAALNIAAFAFCAAAVGAALAPAAALVLVPLILFTMLVPVTVSGWGLREGAAAALLPLAGATAAEGLAASVAFGLVVLIAALPGAVAAARAPAPGPAGP